MYGESIADVKETRVLEGANLSFAARAAKVRHLLDAGSTDQRPTVELVGTSGEHWARCKGEQRQSCDQGFHFRSPLCQGKHIALPSVTLATLNDIGIVEMSRPDDLVSPVSPPMALRRCQSVLLFGMTKQITLHSVVRTLTRLRHATKLGPNVLVYCLVKNYAAKPSELEHLARFLLETAERMRELTRGKHICPECRAVLPESRWDRCYCSPACRQRGYRGRRALEGRYRSPPPEARTFVTRDG
jgi:hypothetical protein